MTYYNPDYTGQDPDYKRTNDIYTLFETGQKIDFEVPIYSDPTTFSITTLGKTPVSLVLGTDYEINSDDVATTAMSRARNANSAFTQQLIKSITIIRPQTALPITVSMTYQQFYCTTPTAPVASGTGNIDVTPDLMVDLWRRVGVCEQQTTAIADSIALPDSYPQLLAFDINGANTDNVVTGEVWTVNTFGNQKVIRPLQGAFFKNSVSLSVGSTPLVPGTDYLILGVNAALTKLTSNTSGIYDLILITKPYAGQVTINSYHAVGGKVTNDTVQSLYSNLYSVKSFLETSAFLTANSLQDVTIIKQMQLGISDLEDKVRILLNGTSAKYGQTTNGVAVSKSIRANDTKIHWWTIASLYTVTGSTTIVTKDRMSLHVELVSSGYMADVDVAFDMSNAARPATITARNVVMDPGFTLFGEVSSVTGVVPMMRVVWNLTSDNVTGAFLQIGLALPGLADTLAIEDRSGVESAWLLDTTTGSTSPLTPSDDAFVLPDGASVWSASGGSSTSTMRVLQNDSGFLALATSTAFTAFDDSVGKAYSFDCALPEYFDLASIKSIDVYTTDVNNVVAKTTLPVVGDLVTSGNVDAKAPIMISSSKDVGVAQATIAPSTSAAGYIITFRIFGTTTISDGINLRYLIANV